MKNVRLGIVGLGNIGRFHTGYLLENKVSRCTLAAVSDAFAPSRISASEQIETPVSPAAIATS